MKNLIKKANTFLGLFLLCFTLISCSSDDDSVTDDSVTEADITAITSTITSGTWKVTSYIDSGEEETSDYVTYVFTFNTDGSLGVTDGGSTSLSGAWSISGSDNSTDDSSDDSVEVMIFFSSPELFVEISDDWDISSYTSTQLKLWDVSGGDGTTDYLTFTKI